MGFLKSQDDVEKRTKSMRTFADDKDDKDEGEDDKDDKAARGDRLKKAAVKLAKKAGLRAEDIK